jgi:hypothetical protein
MSWPELQHPTTIARLFWPWEGRAPVNFEEWTRRVPVKEDKPLR